METHVRILAVLNIVLGSLGALAALLILLLFGGIAGVVGVAGGGDSDSLVAIPILGLIGGAIFVVLIVISLPAIIAGYGLLHHRQWARILTIVISAINLLNVPFGTALGIYGLWVLLSPETEPLFLSPPARMRYP